MGIRDFFSSKPVETASQAPLVHALGGADGQFFSLDDPRLLEFMRDGSNLTSSGISVTTKAALKNTTVMRCVSLISFSIGMLPLHIRTASDHEKAKEHPLFAILHRKPNAWQTAFEWRSLMQQAALTEGNAYSRIIRSGGKVLQLVPLDGSRVTPRQRNDWQVEYKVQRDDGSHVIVAPEDMFHLRYGVSDDGITGVSLVRQAAEAIGLAQQTENAAARLFKNGMMVGGMMSVQDKLSPEAFERLKSQMVEREGADSAHKWIIGEEGIDVKPFASNGRDNQHLEMRKHQVEEIARPFGVPRPLLGVDDTSWGSGIDVLGQMFVRYGLGPWFTAWEQAIERSLLTDAEHDIYEAKFNPGALLCGSMADQAEFFAKGLGSGGHHPFLEIDEVRSWLDMPAATNLPPMPGATSGEPE